jgi:hypothetical protein
MEATMIPLEPKEAVGSVVPIDFENKYEQVTGLQSFVMPKTFDNMLHKAKEYRRIDIVQRLMRIRTDFGSKIKGFRYPSKASKAFWERTFKTVNIRRFCRNFLYDLNTLGVVYPLWEIDETGPLFLTIYDPEKVRTVSALGQEVHFIEPDDQVLDFIRNMDAKQKTQVYIPDYLEKAAKSIKREVPVPKDRIMRICLVMTKTDYEANPVPPLMSVYDSLALRKLLIDTDFSTAYGIRNEIIHVTEGESQRPTTKQKLQQLEELFKNHGKTLMLFTNHTVTINRIAPDSKIWDPQKYKAAEDRILQWGGITKTLITGEGASYASAYISIKALRESIETDREHFEEFFYEFCEQIARKTGRRGIPEIIWDRTSLKEDKAFLQELEFLTKWGIYDPEDLCKEFDIDYDSQVEKRKNNDSNNEFFVPHFEPSQGLLSAKFGVNGSSGEEGVAGRPSANRVQNTNEPRPNQ